MQTAPNPAPNHVPRARQCKRVAANQRVSYSRHKIRKFGNVVRAEGERSYLVRFDDGSEKVCASGALRVEAIHQSLPPDIIPMAPTTTREFVESEEHLNVAVDQDEEEDLPLPDEANDLLVTAEDGEDLAPTEVITTQDDNAGPPPEGMIGQLPSGDSLPKDYVAVKRAAMEKIAALKGHEVTVTSKSMGSVTWKVVESVEPDDVIPELDEKVAYGLKGFDVSNYRKSEVLSSIFLRLLFKNWKEKVEKMNKAVEAAKAKCKPFTEAEFLTGIAILIGAAEFAQRGSDLFSVKDSVAGVEEDDWPSLAAEPHFESYMSFYRFKSFREFFPHIFGDETIKDADPWWQFSPAVEEFNEIRRDEIVACKWISVDEMMSAWRPRKTALGNLPNISFIARKPEPLGKIKLRIIFCLQSIFNS